MIDEKLKIVILCGGRFAMPAIQQLAVEGYLAGIGIGLGESSMVNTLEMESEDKNIGFMHFRNRKDLHLLEEWLVALKPDAVFSICFPFRIAQNILELENIRFINFHTGPLPAYRGAMPLFEVIRRKESHTALTLHFMTPDLDEGPVIMQEFIDIHKEDTFGSLATRMSVFAAQTALNMAQMLEFGTFVPAIEQEEQLAYYYDKPDFSETFIHWKKMTAEEIEALIRACNPWNTGADAILKGKHYKIIDASITPLEHTALPGTITGLDEAGNIYIACKDNKQLLVRILSNDYGILSAGKLTAKENILHAIFD